MSTLPAASRHGPRAVETDARERFRRAVADLAAEPSIATVVRYLRASDGLAAAQVERAAAAARRRRPAQGTDAAGSSADGATLTASAGL